MASISYNRRSNNSRVQHPVGTCLHTLLMLPKGVFQLNTITIIKLITVTKLTKL